jgi:hypothetical protein
MEAEIVIAVCDAVVIVVGIIGVCFVVYQMVKNG